MMPSPDKNTSVFPHGHIDRSTWKRVRLGDYATLFAGGTPSRAVSDYYGGTIPWCSISDISNAGKFLTRTEESLTSLGLEKSSAKLIPADAILFAMYASIGECSLATTPLATSQAILGIYNLKGFDREYLYYYLCSRKDSFINQGQTGTQSNLSKEILSNLQLPKPEIEEQCSIAVSLSTIDTNISALQSLIAKYEAIKKATVNLLLEPKAGWKRMKLDEICMCLDNYRKPVNEVERAGMQGDIPYCGANGIVDYVNDFTIDDSIILIAEDGGYFDQYESRPIAYRMSGKAWINNHAHILKAKSDYCQAFIFYSLEHKDITPFITSGTRAKLTKGELSNIEIDTPSSFQEQRKIAEQITAIDNVLADYKAQLEKARQLKAGMMSYFFG